MLGSIIGKHKWEWSVCGKHPIAADFFSIGCENAIASAFSNWVANGFRKLSQVENALPEQMSWRFWSKGPKKDLICGVVRDSSDRFGRKFPLLAIGSGHLKGWESNLTWLPSAFESAWSWIDYFAAKRMVDYQQLEDEFRMIPMPKADWAEYSAQPQVNENPSIEELETLLTQYAQTDEIYMPLSAWPADNMAQIVTHLHLILEKKLKIIPNSVFMGGLPDSPCFFASNRALAQADFFKLWQVSACH